MTFRGPLSGGRLPRDRYFLIWLGKGRTVSLGASQGLWILQTHPLWPVAEMFQGSGPACATCFWFVCFFRLPAFFQCQDRIPKTAHFLCAAQRVCLCSHVFNLMCR